MVVKNCKAIKHKTHEEYFVVDRITKLDNETVMILSNEENRRLINFDLYSSFGIQVGDRIKVVNKKENCAGDQVMMIMHPRYEVHQLYNFKVKAIAKEEISGYQLSFLIVADDFGFEQRIRINENDIEKYGDEIKCRVVGISPGKLNLFVESI